MLPFYIEIEDYTKCQHIKDLMDMLERPNENSNKKTKPLFKEECIVYVQTENGQNIESYRCKC